MAATVDEIRGWLKEAAKEGATHVIVKVDDFSYEDYPVPVYPGQRPREVVAQGQDRAMECYDLSLPIEPQLAEVRANHWDVTASNGKREFPRPPVDRINAPEFMFSWENLSMSPEEFFRQNAASATRGHLQVLIAGDDSPWLDNNFEWTWIELLEWLTLNWESLTSNEEPTAFTSKTEEENFEFNEAHNFASSLQGASVPRFMVWRENDNDAFLWTQDHFYQCSWAQMLDFLTNLGDTIANRISHVTSDERGQIAVSEWKKVNGKAEAVAPSLHFEEEATPESAPLTVDSLLVKVLKAQGIHQHPTKEAQMVFRKGFKALQDRR
jgi:hypothetical protein